MRLKYRSARVSVFILVLVLWAGVNFATCNGQEPANAQAFASSPGLWRAGVGEGFSKGAHELELLAGAGIGTPILDEHTHNWILGSFQFGWVFTDVLGEGHWYRGNWELVAHLFGGEQFEPDHAYFVGIAPLLRYDFATGSRWVPFIDFGGGATATDIRNGDLSTTFEFNLQAGAGTHFFLRKDLALTFQYRFIHLSNAGMEFPNLGVNSSTFLLGVSWFF